MAYWPRITTDASIVGNSQAGGMAISSRPGGLGGDCSVHSLQIPADVGSDKGKAEFISDFWHSRPAGFVPGD